MVQTASARLARRRRIRRSAGRRRSSSDDDLSGVHGNGKRANNRSLSSVCRLAEFQLTTFDGLAVVSRVSRKIHFVSISLLGVGLALRPIPVSSVRYTSL